MHAREQRRRRACCLCVCAQWRPSWKGARAVLPSCKPCICCLIAIRARPGSRVLFCAASAQVCMPARPARQQHVRWAAPVVNERDAHWRCKQGRGQLSKASHAASDRRWRCDCEAWVVSSAPLPHGFLHQSRDGLEDQCGTDSSLERDRTSSVQRFLLPCAGRRCLSSVHGFFGFSDHLQVDHLQVATLAIARE